MIYVCIYIYEANFIKLMRRINACVCCVRVMIEQEQLAEAQHSCFFLKTKNTKVKERNWCHWSPFISKSMPAPRAILILSLSFSSRDILFLNEFHISSLFLTRRFLSFVRRHFNFSSK